MKLFGKVSIPAYTLHILGQMLAHVARGAWLHLTDCTYVLDSLYDNYLWIF